MRIAPLLLVFATSPAFAGAEDPIENPRLPRLWHVRSRTRVDAATTAAIGKMLGVEMTSLENDVIDAGGIGVRVNLARCPDEKQAEALAKRFAKIHGDELYAPRHGLDVAEIVCENRLVARKARHVLGWDKGTAWEGPACWEATFEVAPLERCDCMKWNKLFNLLAASEDDEENPELERLAKDFVFADALPGAKADAPKAEHVHGIPRIRVVRRESTPVFTTTATPDDHATWTAATDAWPTGAPEVTKALAEALGDKPRTGEDASVTRRVEDILGWVHAHVRYGGEEMGSRYGTVKVIAQGFGHCWDQSDVFVTLCRAAGIPARQVGGWLSGGEGHVWAEVLVGEDRDGGVVLPVDPGTTWLGVSEEYVRLWTSADGRIPFVYWTPVRCQAQTR
jgi:hypothetical protein